MIAAIGDPSIVVAVVVAMLTNCGGESVAVRFAVVDLHVPMQLTPDC